MRKSKLKVPEENDEKVKSGDILDMSDLTKDKSKTKKSETNNSETEPPIIELNLPDEENKVIEKKRT